ncbi:MAG: collagenase [Melioribacteraceae bacterium]|nr:MAG: collagenase [Melioribacteraceae bacterium]
MKKPELLAPAGNKTNLIAAIKNGADAVYFGVENLNMRAAAKNFNTDELPELVAYCKEHEVDTHLTMNTIVYENELDEIDKILTAAKAAGIDMIICWDMAVIQRVREYEIPFCISTQASISNSAAAQFYKDLGAKRIVLARECTLDQIKEIKSKVDIEIEAFVHGAMCVAISGRCFMSHEVFNRSANRGDCLQPCRREFKIYDTHNEAEYLLGEDYVLSPKDLYAMPFIDQLIEAGIDSFKIEGRKRSPEYISKVIRSYREAIDLYFINELTDEKKAGYEEELKKVYNRGFSPGFYFNTQNEDQYAGIYGSKATTRKTYAGKVINFFKQSSIAHVKLEAAGITKEDELYIIGNATGIIELKLSDLFVNDVRGNSANKGDEITFPVPDRVRPGDKLYKVVQAEQNEK